MTGPNSGLGLGWETLEGMVKGVSAIDMSEMNIEDLDEAEDFIKSYGFDFNHPADREELRAIQDEAISFIERRLLDPAEAWEDDKHAEAIAKGIPAVFKTKYDCRHIMCKASTGQGLEQRWACAILKVMHTLCHINNAVLYRYFEEARHQILSRYYRAITHTRDGDILFGQRDGLSLSLVGFEIKDEKSRDSMLLKLLAKRENVAEEIFDMVGVRLITHTPVEAILALEILRDNKIVIFPNLIPSRSRNALIDFDVFKTEYQSALKPYHNKLQSLNETLDLIRNIQSHPDGTFNPMNTSTLAEYRSIHLTERHLIRFNNPALNEEIRFFFPYEIQIIDQANYIQALSGSSAHSLYKRNQLVQARRRVLGPLLIASRKAARKSRVDLEQVQ